MLEGRGRLQVLLTLPARAVASLAELPPKSLFCRKCSFLTASLPRSAPARPTASSTKTSFISSSSPAPATAPVDRAHRRLNHRSRTFSSLAPGESERLLKTATQHPSHYDFRSVENKWIDQWRQGGLTNRDDAAKSKSRYVLCMFPYPSGNLHMGHLRVYTIGDVLARFERMRADDDTVVINPMGWDAFGLPAENAAIDRGVDAESWTRSNIASMREQLIAMGTSFDWEREVTTCDPEYYKWTQYLFLKLYKAGLVYRAASVVNWDPVDKTVLANEQVDAAGRAERSGAFVEKRKLEQWFVKITDYAEDLLADLDLLDWPDNVKHSQVKWIGKTEGVEFSSHVLLKTKKNSKSTAVSKVTIFSDQETLENATFVALSADHPILIDLEDRNVIIRNDKRQKMLTPRLSPFKKNMMGYGTGLKILNPVTGKFVPVFVAGFVTEDVPLGAIFAAPKLDKNSEFFAKRHNIPMEPIEPTKVLDPPTFRPALKYRLRDWLISRQRYWGAPVPIIHCSSCGPVPVPEEELPVVLPKSVKLTGRGDSPLNAEEWVKTTCPSCKKEARRDTDTMDTFVDSSWYWLRYLDAKNDKSICESSKSAERVPVDVYVGGVEHSILHLLYARFIGKFLLRSGIVQGKRFEEAKGEPFRSLLAQGMVLGRTLRCPDSQRYLKPEELDLTDPDNPKMKATGQSPVVSFEKMSKSKFNGVEPSEVLQKHGVDATRLYILYKAAPTDQLSWDEAGIVGMGRWLQRCWRLVKEIAEDSRSESEKVDERASLELRAYVSSTVKEVTAAVSQTRGFHVAIASLIKLTSFIESVERNSVSVENLRFAVETLIKMMGPFAPCASSEMWQIISKNESAMVIEGKWPVPEEVIFQRDIQTCVVTINGKMRGTIEVPLGAEKDVALLEAIVREPRNEVGRWLLHPETGKPLEVRRAIVKKGQNSVLVNFVV
ncbi:leucyl-tRNA synthetase [Zopfochytrium polystomum]|nr:leucyl-tRNA synthetase [Zopfochytrium polystomum]